MVLHSLPLLRGESLWVWLKPKIEADKNSTPSTLLEDRVVRVSCLLYCAAFAEE